jgi:hypothetical protein
MNERIYNLPEHFIDGNLAKTSINFYRTGRSSQKKRVCFSQNLLCILLDGHKEVLSGPSKIS